MKRFSAVPTLVAAAILLPAAAHAAFIELSVSGVITAGTDERAMFTRYDEPNDAIVGRPYTMSFTIDTSQFSHTFSSTAHAAHSHPDGPLDFWGKATIGPQTHTWSLNWGNAVTATLGPGADAVMEIDGEFGYRESGHAIIGFHPQGPGAPSLDGLAFEQRIVYRDLVAPGSYSAGFDVTYVLPRQPDDNGAEVYRTWFTGTVEQAVWQVSPVPEPAHYGMLAAGLAVLARARLRARRRGATAAG